VAKTHAVSVSRSWVSNSVGGRRPTTRETLEFSSAELAQLCHDLTEVAKPPLGIPCGFEQAKSTLLDLGLLALVGGNEDPSSLVHRWTAAALARQEPAEHVVNAHHRAARYWRWRIRSWAQSQQDDLEQVLEAGSHHHAAGELDEALAVTNRACHQLHTWGASSWEERLCQEVLAWIPAHSHWEATFTYRLGMLAQDQGDYEEAHRQYQRSFKIFEELGHRVGMASSYGQLGLLLTEIGKVEEAVG